MNITKKGYRNSYEKKPNFFSHPFINPNHSGTTNPNSLQKSHLAPLPPSHEIASTRLKLVNKPGC